MNREMLKTRPLKIMVKFNFGDGCACKFVDIVLPVDFQVLPDGFKHDQDAVLQKLRDTALEDMSSGQYTAAERTVLSDPRCETTVCAIVTSIVEYDTLLQSYNASRVRLKSSGNIFKKRNKVMNGMTPPKRLKGY